MSKARVGSVSPSSYRNMIFNQSAYFRRTVMLIVILFGISVQHLMHANWSVCKKKQTLLWPQRCAWLIRL